MKRIQQKQKDFQSLLEKTANKDMMNILSSVFLRGKYALEETIREVGVNMVEALLFMEREQISGPSYSRTNKEYQKWASQGGSVYLGDRKVKIKKPRLRDRNGEVNLKLYERLKDPGQFSEELLSKVFNGLSMRRYKETLSDAGEALGVSPGSISNRIKEVTAKRLKQFKERSLKGFKLFGMFIDGIHFHGSLYIVAMGINLQGGKKMLGFWEGATENHDVCKELLDDLERRGLLLHKGVVYVTDGGSGLIKCLRERFGQDLIHQRCIIHKKNNIVNHLPRQYRAKAKKIFSDAVMCTKYHDAKKGLLDLKTWLAQVNESAAKSLGECIEELITIQR
ncbi:MAG TPA: transposase, partial [Spirochaetota bacterium]|nr:transposase [Spirochaetota bacterium]